jgi:hypothetical protein
MVLTGSVSAVIKRLTGTCLEGTRYFLLQECLVSGKGFRPIMPDERQPYRFLKFELVADPKHGLRCVAAHRSGRRKGVSHQACQIDFLIFERRAYFDSSRNANPYSRENE